jgi:hypothetical protein
MFQRLWRLLTVRVGFRETGEEAIFECGSCVTAAIAPQASPTAESSPLPPVTVGTMLVVEATVFDHVAVVSGRAVEPAREPTVAASPAEAPSNVIALFAASRPDRRLAARGLAVARLNPPKSRAPKKSAIASATKPILKRPNRPSTLKSRRDLAAPRVLAKRVRTADVIHFDRAAASGRDDRLGFTDVASAG